MTSILQYVTVLNRLFDDVAYFAAVLFRFELVHEIYKLSCIYDLKTFWTQL